ncbi:thiamine pyrophosphate-dependent enzyme, partial [Mycolicibacterium porcinum]|uniref:thiamine pyrophosphate-dependent enzyme n=1 Tax=Mycolicibacterium porcinum TaxID=39693 RepID=UPI0034CD9098
GPSSRPRLKNPWVRCGKVNVGGLEGGRSGGVRGMADAGEARESLSTALDGYRVSDEYRSRVTELAAEWEDTVSAAYATSDDGAALNQNQVIGLVNTLSDPHDVVVCAAGSMPGDLHKMWRTRDRKGYHVEYGYSCMGYEIAGGIGVRMAAPDRDVFVMVGDGSYLMMATELVTAVQEGIKIIPVLVQNHGFASIGGLSESLGSQRFGTAYRYRTADGRLDGDTLPVDLAANAASLGADVIKVTTAAEFTDAVKAAKAADRTTVIHVETDPLIYAPDSQSWWDVPVSEVSTLESTQSAYERYADWKKVQRPLVNPSDR